MTTHAPLPPSSAARIVACAGSRKMAELYPEEDTIDTQEGEAAHWAGAELIRGEQVAVGQVAANGVTLTAEMVEAAEDYASYIIKRDRVPCQAHIEEHVASGALHPENYGTPDYWMYSKSDHHLFIDDFKYGHGFVNEVCNWQLINYVALVARKLAPWVFEDDALKVTMTIHQPRSYHRRGPHRSVTVRLGELRPYFATLANAFVEAMKPDAPVTASDPDECLKCTGRVYCEAAIAAEYWGVDMAYDSTPLIMSPAALSKEYRTLLRAEKMIKARREGIAESIKSTIRRGTAVPFFGIAHSKGRTVWKPDAIEQGIVEIGQAYGAQVEKPALITPLQAIKAGIPEDVVKLYSDTPSGSAELVEEDGNEAARVFG